MEAPGRGFDCQSFRRKPICQQPGSRANAGEQPCSYACLHKCSAKEAGWRQRFDTAVPDKNASQTGYPQNVYFRSAPLLYLVPVISHLLIQRPGVIPQVHWQAGCPVVVKAHAAHLQTSVMVAGAIQKAIKETGMPEHVFSTCNGKAPSKQARHWYRT